jgi:CRISPR-associated exonuclease Cas4
MNFVNEHKFPESALLPLAGLQHMLFCERQCALMFIEHVWEDNFLTADGSVFHEKAHEPSVERRKGVKIARELALKSLRLGLSGKADVVEFYLEGKLWRPFPVEYKRGKPKANDCDSVQLCAQAICLGEMLDVEIPRGALFYGKTRRRFDVEFDTRLRALTEATAVKYHRLIDSGITPPAEYSKRCESCSLLDICKPKGTANRSVARYLGNILRPKD